MKTRIFILAGLSIVVAGSILILKNQFNLNTKTGKYRVEMKEKGEDEEIRGAVEFYNMIMADPTTGKVNPDYVKNAYLQADRLSMTRATGLGINWKNNGPDNIGGRIRGLIIDKDDPSILYASGVSGGFYKSTTYGSYWVKKDYAANPGGLIISCMSQTTDGTIYFGTGEQYFTAMSTPDGRLVSGFPGGGIYKSTDKGETWQYLTSTDPTSNIKWMNVQNIAADPIQPNKLYVATQGGLLYTTDGGTTWKSYPGSSSLWYADVKISPDGHTLYAVSYNGSCKLYRSVDGASLTQITNTGMSTSDSRIVVAISPSNPNYVYASAADAGYSIDGIFLSKDNGSTWQKIVEGGSLIDPLSSSQPQGQYDQIIAVDPYNPDRLFVGGVDFYIWDSPFFYEAASLGEFLDNDQTYRNVRFIHADKHAIVFDTVSKPYRMYVGSDGGITVSSNAQYSKYPTYSTINTNLHTTQFYALAVSQQDGYVVGGTQDNNTLKIDLNGYTGKNAVSLIGGDGSYAEISKFNPAFYYVSIVEGAIYKSSDRGKNLKKMASGAFTTAVKNKNFTFNTPFRLWEDTVRKTFFDSLNKPFDSTVLISKFYVAAINGLWLTENATDFTKDSCLWFKVATFNITPVCMENSSDGDVVYVGGGNGLLYRISGLRGATYKYDIFGNFDPLANGIKTELIKTWPSQTVCGIGISPGNNNNMVVTLGNYVASSYDHVYLTKNALAPAVSVTFTSIQGTSPNNLPYMPVYDGAIHSFGNGTDTIIVASELRIWATTNGGSKWTEENKGMDRVPTFMIRQVPVKPSHWHTWQRGLLYYIGTHGCGIYSTDFFAPGAGINNQVKKTDNNLTIYPNPASDYTTLKFTLKQATNLKADIYDLEGKLVKSISITSAIAGENNVRLNTEELVSGTYLIRLNGKNTAITSRLVIINSAFRY